MDKYVARVRGNIKCKEHFYVPCTLDEYGRALQSEVLSFLHNSKIGNAYYFDDEHGLVCVIEYYVDEEEYCDGVFGNFTILDAIPDYELSGWETIPHTVDWEIKSIFPFKEIRLIEPNMHGSYRYFRILPLDEATPEEGIKLTTLNINLSI